MDGIFTNVGTPKCKECGQDWHTGHECKGAKLMDLPETLERILLQSNSNREAVEKLLTLFPQHKMTMVNVICLNCDKEFKKREAEIKRSPNHFCSKPCTGEYRVKENSKALFEKVKIASSGCWEWQDSVDSCGYGRTRYKRRLMSAHRAAYIHKFGGIPEGMHVLHRCDNPPCINPAHLFLGTHQDNMDDMAAKGRRYKKPKEGE
jgi:hypothetical protein